MNRFHQLIDNALFRWGIALLWTVFFTVKLLQPGQQALVAAIIQPAPASIERELLFTSLHLITFGLTAWIWCFALRLTSDTKHVMIVLLVALLVYGASAELLQMRIPGRSAQWWDMLANGLGISVGITLWMNRQAIQWLKSDPHLSTYR